MAEQTGTQIAKKPLTDRRTVLEVRMELLSDAIFGSGFSIPGGEDMAVNQDRQGWPYMKGSTFKGLLRESLQNLLVWTGGDEADLNALMGVPGWDNPGGNRRIHLTELALAGKAAFPDRPVSPDGCYSLRTFTSLDGGVVKTDTLRTASCIRQGMVFTGLLYCQPEDADLLKQALLGVKWVGTMRSRGFGRVRVTGTAVEKAGTVGKAGICAGSDADLGLDSGADTRKQDGLQVPSGGSACIRYHIHTDSPVLATDMAGSWGNSWETLHCIPGAAVRGAIIRRWIETHPDEAGQEAFGFLRELLSDGVCFSDVFPTVSKSPATEKSPDKMDFFVPLPSPMGFYEDKRQERFHSILWKAEADTSRLSGEPLPGCKKAKLGHFCALEDGKVVFWNASTDSTLRIQRGNPETAINSPDDNDGRQVFETRCLDAGQDFSGSVTLDNPALAEKIASLFTETLWLGADRYGGFGRCSVNIEGMSGKPEIHEKYSIKDPNEIEKREEKTGQAVETFYSLYLLLLSPVSMRNQSGEPCGLDETALAHLLGVDTVAIRFCAASVSDYSGYNSTWECRVPGARMYDRGSVFQLRCSSAPSLENIHAVERSGLGIRRAEGYGQVLFLSPRLYEGLTGKIPYKKYLKRKEKSGENTKETSCSKEVDHTADAARLARRARFQWIMDKSALIQRGKVSRSQIGTIQALCENAVAHGGDCKELFDFLGKNLTDRGAVHGDRFTVISEIIHKVMEEDSYLPELMNGSNNVEKLKLLCQLFNYSRKAKGNANASRNADRKEGEG